MKDKVDMFVRAGDEAIAADPNKEYQFGPVKFMDEQDCLAIGSAAVKILSDKYPGKTFTDESTTTFVSFYF